MEMLDKELPKFGGVEWLLYFCSTSLPSLLTMGGCVFYTNEGRKEYGKTYKRNPDTVW